MLKRIFVFSILGLGFSSAVFAQTNVTTTTGGTVGQVPVFSGSGHNVENSNITQSGGNVGIGTSSPSNTLSVNGDVDFGARLKFDTPNAYGGNTAVFGLNNSSGNARFVFYDYVTSQGLMGINNVASGGGVLIGPSYITSGGVNTAPSNGLAVQGRVGIGTTTPGASLEVNGGLKFTGGSSGGITFADGSVINISSGTSGNATTTPFSSQGGGYNVFSLGSMWAGDNNSVIELGQTNTGGNNNSRAWIGAEYNWNNSSNLALFAAKVGNGTLAPYDAIRAMTFVGGDNSNTQVAAYLNGGLFVGPSSSNTDPGVNNLQVTGNSYVMGNVGIGTTTPGAKLDVGGSVKISGSGASLTFPDTTVQSTAWTGTLTGGDYAESMDVTGNRDEYEPGDVLVLDSEHPGHVLKVAQPYSTLAAGVYATKPGVVGRRQKIARELSETEVPMAMIGVVPTKVTAENGAIKVGDLLVISSKSGYAMKGTDRAQMVGAVIGKAMQRLDSGTGVIEVLITLQ